MGFSKTSNSLHLNVIEKKRVYLFGGNFFNNRNSYNTYEPVPSLFEDLDKGKLAESYWLGYGFNKGGFKTGYYIGAGLSMKKEYFRRDDPRDYKEVYYIKDNDNSSIMPTLIFGSYMKIGKALFGMAVNLIPLDFSINLFFPVASLDYPS